MRKTKHKEVGGKTLFDEKLLDKLTHERDERRTETWFGRHKEVMREVGEILKELKASGQREFIINNFGPGRVRGGGYVNFETFELINQAERVGIKPEELKVYVYDRVLPPLIATEGTKKIELSNTEQLRVGDANYIKEFFPKNRREGEESSLIIEIDSRWRDRIKSFHLDLKERPAIEKADVTFACLQVERHELDLNNLVESTKKGGFIICNLITEEIGRVGLKKVFEREDIAIYKRC